MNQGNQQSRPVIVTAFVVLTAVAAVIAVVYHQLTTTGSGGSPATDIVSEEVTVGFYKSLAALDVEENERAARVLKEIVRAEPREPALWANLAVAQLRLRDMEAAEDSLEKALLLATDSRELALLRAELLEHSGQIEPAIEQFRTVHHVWPENVAATYSLVSLLGQVRSTRADAERLVLLLEILDRAPGNLRARCEQARLAATLERGEEVQTALDALSSRAESWPDAVKQQLADAEQAAEANDFQSAARSLTFMENVLKPHPQYQQSLAQLGSSSVAAIGTPLRNLLRLKLPRVEAAAADLELAFELQDIPKTAARPDLVLALERAGERRSTLLSLSGGTLQAGESAALPFPGSSTEAVSTSIVAADLNFDFVQDLVLVGHDGCRIYLGSEDGTFAAHETNLEDFAQSWRSAWSVDVEADGDLDLLLSDHQSSLRWIRNNGNMTFTSMPNFLDATKVDQLLAADLDADGDVDLATLATSGAVAVWKNERGGEYAAAELPFQDPQIAFAVGDVDRNGQFDVVAFSRAGRIHAATWNADGTWTESLITEWAAEDLADRRPGAVFLDIADIDNNGAVDLVASHRYTTAVWLRTEVGKWTELPATPAISVASIVDMNDDGLLDLVGLAEDGGRAALNRSQAGYGWHVLETLANTGAGDKRINPFGIGGRIEMRAGSLVQATVIRSPRSYLGLGHHELADIARIVWPNGTVQAEFDLQAKEKLIARQRLKGSCPWVFAFDGKQFHFVKDFLWRSPLGLRINAQDTAGVLQTKDWIKIPRSQLAAVDGRYKVRITAELWETHFFDLVELLAVDHPADVEVLVDERFVPNEAPSQRPLVITPRQPLQNITSHRGRSLDETLHAIDGRYADRFPLGQYQGVAEEHWIAFDVPPEVDGERNVWLVGNGWVYPTDSSLNVALAQGTTRPPFGLVLEQQDTSGRWHVLRDNLGFPAGKNKDVVIALPEASLAVGRRFRLRTNMEVYWDTLAWCYVMPDVEPHVQTLPMRVGKLRYRGYSKLLPTDRRRPDTPVYQVEATEQRWLDLEGYYTRYGDVHELLSAVDDRYVIMNAGDELIFEFAAGDDLPPGWQRDFVLVGDGWVKDGDLNTAFSRWVRPLPTHRDSNYSGPLGPLETDPVYSQHRDDWQRYHTRYITPRRFQRGLWPSAPHAAKGENER